MTIFRKKPEISAYEEGQQEAENMVGYWEETYGAIGTLAHLDNAAQAAENMFDHPRVQREPEWQELLHGYLSKLF